MACRLLLKVSSVQEGLLPLFCHMHCPLSVSKGVCENKLLGVSKHCGSATWFRSRMCSWLILACRQSSRLHLTGKTRHCCNREVPVAHTEYREVLGILIRVKLAPPT